VNPGSKGNVASGSINTSVNSIIGVDSVTNPNQTTDGRDRELDSAYRQRVLSGVGENDITSGQRIYNELTNLNYINQVRYIDNSEDEAGSGLNAHEVELVIDSEPGHKNEIAQIIFNNIAMGANLVSGAHGSATSGTASLSNGQTYTIPFSVPSDVSTYVSADVTLNGSINENELKNAIVEYIGGTKTNGQQIYGNLNVGEDVLYGEIEFALRELQGVYDVTNLNLDTTSPPSGTSNIAISSSERAVIDASDITINTTTK
jgi:uncharacterized phage protein gp47/JayE